MGKKKTKQEVRPYVAEPLSSSVNDLTNSIDLFGDIDPQQFVAPTSPLQQQAFDGVQNLGGWQSDIAQAQNMAHSADAQRPALATAVGYNAAQLGVPSQATSAQLGSAPHVAAARLGAAPIASAAQLGPVHHVQAAQLGSNAQQQASLAGFQSILENGGIAPYLDSGIESFVNNSVASFDNNAAKTRALQQAQAAKAGAFGGSRHGVASATFDAEAALGRGQLEGSLRRDNYAMGLNAAIADAQRRTGVDLANAATQTAVSGRNADAADQFALNRANFGQQANIFNAGASNDFLAQNAGFQQQANLSNQAMLGEYGLAQGQFDQQANLANQDMLARYGLAQGQFDQQTKLFNTGATNDFTLQQAGLDADAAQFGATAQNQASLANAGFTDADMNRSLQAAGIYGGLANDMGNQYRADLGLMAGLGDVQRGIASQYANAIPQQLMMLSQLYGGVYPAYIGQNSTTTQSGGLGGAILGALAGSIGNGLMGGTKPWILGR